MIRGIQFSRIFAPSGFSSFARHHSQFRCATLNQRGAIRIRGKEAGQFLQGLVTNDIGHIAEIEDEDVGFVNEDIEEDESSLPPLKKSMYSFFLNTAGRIMFDSIIFRGVSNEEFWIDCDAELCSKLLKHLKMYKVRRKLELKNMSEEFKTLAVWSTNEPEKEPPKKGSSQNGQDSFFANNIEDSESVTVTSSVDPRNIDLGHRAILPKDFDIRSLFPDRKLTLEPTGDGYTELRYRLGIAEGSEEIPFGKCFPLEYNADYLHGVSFQKGCYIGQELTARTHHTGVIRKRIMPLSLSGVDGHLEFGTTFVNESEKRVGNLRGQFSTRLGLGLMRIAECADAQRIGIKSLSHEKDIKIYVSKPEWWPIEASKKSRAV